MTAERVDGRRRRADSGKACPYCRFALKPGAGVVDCPSCSATHHDECWGDNGGCAIMGCASAPSLAGGAPATTTTAGRPPPPTPPPPPAHSAPHAASPAPLRPARHAGAHGRRPAARAGARRRGRRARRQLQQRAPRAGREQCAAAGHHGDRREPPDVHAARSLPRPSNPSTPRQIEALLQRYYGAVRTGDFARAWRMLSPTYKTWKAGNGGFAKWQEQESRNRAHLRVGDLDVSVRSFDAVDRALPRSSSAACASSSAEGPLARTRGSRGRGASTASGSTTRATCRTPTRGGLAPAQPRDPRSRHAMNPATEPGRAAPRAPRRPRAPRFAARLAPSLNPVTKGIALNDEFPPPTPRPKLEITFDDLEPPTPRPRPRAEDASPPRPRGRRLPTQPAKPPAAALPPAWPAAAADHPPPLTAPATRTTPCSSRRWR